MAATAALLNYYKISCGPATSLLLYVIVLHTAAKAE